MAELENVLESKVKPIIDEAMQKYMGITIQEIQSDISDKLKRNPLLDIDVDTSISFKQAKKNFKKHYLVKLLSQNWGNVSKVSEIAKVDRRSIHRLVSQLGIDVNKMRKEMVKREYVKRAAVRDIIESTLDHYKSSIAPESLEKMYQGVPVITNEIVREIPEIKISLKKAMEEFEKKYIKKALKENRFNTVVTSKKIGLRYESLHRKIKELGI